MNTRTSTIASILLIGAGAYLLLRRRTKTTNNMGNSKLPRGYRNNNPLNIRYSSANNWLGKITPNTDGSFEQFSSMAYGYRAALYLIRKYISNGAITVSEVISKWAPSNDNDTANYINLVCGQTGYTPGTVLDADNKEQLCKLVYAMAIVENGTIILPSMSEIQSGWALLK